MGDFGRACPEEDGAPCQDVALTFWAFAAAGIVYRALLAALSNIAQDRAHQLNMQNVSNIVWALATLLLKDRPLLSALAHCTVGCCRETCGPQEVSNTAWAFATLVVYDAPLLEVLLQASAERLSEYNAQELSNTIWSIANLAMLDSSLLDAIADAVQDTVGEFDVQNLANTVWAMASMVYINAPVFDAIARRSVDKMPEFTLQAVANTLWACATLSVADLPFVDAIATQAFGLLKRTCPSPSETDGFLVDVCALGWSFTFLTWQHPILGKIRDVVREVGARMDLAAGFLSNLPHAKNTVHRAQEAQKTQQPTILGLHSGICIVLKPPGWEVDSQGQSGLRRLSSFL